MIYMGKQKIQSILEEPNGPDALIAWADQAFEPAWEMFLDEENAAAGAFIIKVCKHKKYREEIEKKLADPAANAKLKGMLAFEEGNEAARAKLRKNAARLMGELKHEDFLDPLIAALDAEKIRFVRPSMLLAIGAIGGDKAATYLNRYRVLDYVTEGPDLKHQTQELEALNIARRSQIKLPKHTFTGLDREYEFELRAPEKLVGSLLFEMQQLGIKPQEQNGDSVLVRASSVDKLLQLRSMQSMLIPVASNLNENAGGHFRFCSRFMQDFFESCTAGDPPYGYRIELRGNVPNRSARIKIFASIMDTEKLLNTPSAYELELIFETLPRCKNRCNVYARPTFFNDTRFDYREESLPASIHPATAAAIIRYAREHMKPNARVLDPCCGSGTMLIEREKFMPVEGLTGVDIAHRAIEIARGNAKKAGSKAKFVCNDMLRFEAKRPYDEIIANLPFGNRVGSHANNEILYAGMLDKLPAWLNKDGVAIFYTMEFTLLKKLIRKRPYLRLVTETRTEAGGLMPGIFIVKLN